MQPYDDYVLRLVHGRQYQQNKNLRQNSSDLFGFAIAFNSI